jgi:hypothetical protein
LSVVVGMVKDGKVYLAADTRGLVDWKQLSVQKLYVSTHPQWGRWAMGSVGHMRNAEIADEMDLPTLGWKERRSATPQKVIRCYLDGLRDQIEKRGVTEGNGVMGNDFLLALDGHLFRVLEFYMQDVRIAAIGSGSAHAEGVLNALLKYNPDMPPEQMVRFAVETAAYYLVAVGGKIDVVVI